MAKKRVLLIDDEGDFCRLVAANLGMFENLDTAFALTGKEGLEYVESFKPNIVFLDINLPDTDGVSLIGRVLKINKEIPVVMLSGRGTHDNVQESFRSGAVDFITKPCSVDKIVEMIKKYIDPKVGRKHGSKSSAADKSLTKALFLEMSASFVSLSEAKSKYLKGHSARVARLAKRIGVQMGLDKDQLEILVDSAILHDLGKVGTKDSILDKEASLSREEYDHIKKHPALGSEVINKVRIFRLEVPLVRHHHERHDGKGYPDGLKGEAIPLGARIIAVADAYDAMRSFRPYRGTMKRSKAISEIREGSGTQFDPEVVKAFLKMTKD